MKRENENAANPHTGLGRREFLVMLASCTASLMLPSCVHSEEKIATAPTTATATATATATHHGHCHHATAPTTATATATAPTTATATATAPPLPRPPAPTGWARSCPCASWVLPVRS